MINETIDSIKDQWASSIDSTISAVSDSKFTIGSGINNTANELIEQVEEESSLSNKYINNSKYDITAVTIWNILSEETSSIKNEDAYAIAAESVSSSNSSLGDSTSSFLEDSTFSSTETTSKEGDLFSGIVNVSGNISSWIYNLTSYIGRGNVFAQTLSSILGIISNNLKDYQNGISETTFGSRMEETWFSNNDNSFLSYFAGGKGNYKIKILNSTPLDSGDQMESLYGNLMLGAPFLFNGISDPNNRTLINSFIKDGRFLSLTPGLPKYNGGSYTQSLKDNILYQTETPSDMLAYLLKNGIDKTFSNKDKRYYTFQTKYDEYYAYLEAMLTPIWIKLGLASEGNTFSLFSFFNIKSNENTNGEEKDIDISSSGNYKILKSKYKSIGFFLNASSAVSESINSQPTSFGAEIGSSANAASENYQKINFLTGMGTGPSYKGVQRLANVAYTAIEQGKDLLSSTFSKTSTARSFLGIVTGLVSDVSRFSSTQDISSVIQSFATTNGMKVTYPELWSDSSYSKNMNFNLNFTSPYGDPLSIFQYVYVPFCALLAFALPRQADSNGYVSPFFVRADIPGLISSDLALVTDVTWTKGGDNNIWTKDGLPRSISCAITITDLYPYLAMTKRYSFLSANPSYTVFLDNMAGLSALNRGFSDDPLNDYWRQMLSRISGENNGIVNNALWNKFNSARQQTNKNFGNLQRSSLSKTTSSKVVPWLTST